MDCIYTEYIKFVDNFLSNYYRILLENKYDKNLVKPFIDKYIDVRYYNKSTENTKDFTERLNRELNSVAKELIKENEKKTEQIKNIFALFSYVLFIDGCSHFSDINALLKALFHDKNITLNYETETKKAINNLVKDYINKKVEFFKMFSSDEFYLKGKKYQDHLYEINLGNNCNMPKIYSDYALEKAYNSIVVTENKLFLTIIMLSSKILSEVIALDFSNNYVVEFPTSLFDKSKKIVRILKALDDDLLKEKISIKVYYKDYKKYKKDILDLITQGYSVSLELDDTYNTNFDDLFLFSNIFVSQKYNYYDIIIDSRDVIKTNIVTV